MGQKAGWSWETKDLQGFCWAFFCYAPHQLPLPISSPLPEKWGPRPGPHKTSLEEKVLCHRLSILKSFTQESVSQTAIKTVHSPSFNFEEKSNTVKMTDLIADCLCLLNYFQIFNLYQETFCVRTLKQNFRVEIEAFKLFIFTEVTNILLLQLVF